VLLKEYFMALKLEIMDCYSMADISDQDLERVITSATQEAIYNEEQY
jgi:hypothetical protein